MSKVEVALARSSLIGTTTVKGISTGFSSPDVCGSSSGRRGRMPSNWNHIAPGVVHRDVNPNKQRRFAVASLLLGKGPPVVNVKGPKA